MGIIQTDDSFGVSLVFVYGWLLFFAFLFTLLSILIIIILG